MTVKDVKKCVSDMKKFTKEVSSSKDKSRKFLVKAGIYTPKGNLTKAYK